ncbi:MAG: hypothetical protein V4857_10855 [Pseudomonadota bacterium]
MSNKHWDDDAEFDAFLKGEHALSHGLKSLPHPRPPAALDDAILQRVMAGLAEDARSAPAANDPGEQVQPRPGKPFSTRWGVPAALAASVLFAVVGVRQWEGDRAQQAATEQALGEPAVAVEAAPQAAPPAAEASAGAPVVAEAAPAVVSAAPADVIAAPAAGSSAPAKVRGAPAEARAAPKRNFAETRPSARAPVPVSVAAPQAPEPMPMPMPMPAPAPAPAPPPAFPASPPAPGPAPFQVQKGAAAARPDDMSRVEITGSRVRRSQVDSAAPVTVLSREELRQRQSQDAAAPPSFGLDKKSESAAAKPAPRLSAGLAENATQTPAYWLGTIDKLIEAGERRRALEEWNKFLAAYPDHPVSEAMLARVKRLQD